MTGELGEGYFVVGRGPNDFWRDASSSNEAVYHKDGDAIRYTGIIRHWERKDRMDTGTFTIKGFTGQVYPTLGDAAAAWEAAGRPSFAEPDEWMAPRYATIVGETRIYPPAPPNGWGTASPPLFEEGAFVVSLPPKHFVYHKDGDDVRFTGLRFTRDLRAPRDELPQIVSGADGETYGSLEEALTAWEAAGRPEHTQPEGRYGPLVRLEEKPSIGPRP